MRVEGKSEGGLSQICCGKLSDLIMVPSPREVRCSNTELEKSSHFISSKEERPRDMKTHNKMAPNNCFLLFGICVDPVVQDQI